MSWVSDAFSGIGKAVTDVTKAIGDLATGKKPKENSPATLPPISGPGAAPGIPTEESALVQLMNSKRRRAQGRESTILTSSLGITDSQGFSSTFLNKPKLGS